MKMNEYLAALQTHWAARQSINSDSIMELLYDACSETTGMDNAKIKADFEELYRLMNNKRLQEVDEIIYAVCTLCRDHEKAGFIEGVKVGIGLGQELAK